MSHTADTSIHEDFSSTLARFAMGVSVANLPAHVIEAAKANIFDTLACAASGSSADAVSETRELAAEWGGAPQATVLVYGDRLPAHHAAWVNGTMAHARDYDDTHDAAVLHAGVSVVPAALAAAELAGNASGADVVAGVAAGLETICRLGVATQLTIIESGFIYTPLFGYFAATVAAARIMKLDHAQFVNAIGIAYSQVSGNHQVTRDAALTKRMQPGFAAMSALLAVQLAKKGIRGAQNTFEGADGFLRVYLRDKVDRDNLRNGLGERWEFPQLSYKPYPCCRLNHSAIGAAIELRAAIGGRVDRIKRVRVGINHQSYEAVCTPVEVRKAPRTIVQAQFSVPYTVATALVKGGVGLGHFTEEALKDADVLALAAKVEGYVDSDIERTASRSVTPALVHVELDDGSLHTLRVDLPLGHPYKPMSREDFDAKAVDCFGTASPPLPASAARLLRTSVDALETLADASPLVAALASGRIEGTTPSP